jgi:hypothetical protein
MLLLPALFGPISAQMFPIWQSSDWIDRKFWILIRLIRMGSRAACRILVVWMGRVIRNCFCGLDLAQRSEFLRIGPAVMIRW